MDCIAIIPARYASVRFPGKPLASLDGRPMLAHVVARVKAIEGVERVLVATDDERIASVAADAGADPRITPADLASGTDRVARVAREEGAELILNVQGDEPLLEPKGVARALEAFAVSDADFGTLRAPLAEPEDLFDPGVVKVVTDDSGRALYFSRAPIPFPRDSLSSGTAQAEAAAADGGEGPVLRFGPVDAAAGPWWIHVGVYLYRRRGLERWARMPPSTLEQTEGLEQLRILQAGEVMQTFPLDRAVPGVDTPEDLRRVERLLAGAGADSMSRDG